MTVKKPQRYAITLLELLVVNAIIGILVAWRNSVLSVYGLISVL